MSSLAMVHILSPDDFDRFVNSSAATLIAFNIVTLEHLERQQAFVTEFQKVACALEDVDIVCGQLDVLQHTTFAGQFEIPSWSIPQVRLFRGREKFLLYEGRLESAWSVSNHNVGDLCPNFRSIVAWTERAISFPALSRLSDAGVLDFQNSCDKTVITRVREPHVKHAYTQLAEKLYPDFVFGIIDDDECSPSDNAGIPYMSTLSPDTGLYTNLPISNNITHMTQRLRRLKRLLIDVYSPETHDCYMGIGLDLGYLVVDSNDKNDALLDSFRDLAKLYRQTTAFLLADPSTHRQLVEDLHLSDRPTPAFAIRTPTTFRRYPMEESAGSVFPRVRSFLDSYYASLLTPSIKSEPLPEDTSANHITRVVGLSFANVVLDNSQDVLLVYTIAACHPCDDLMAAVAALAETYAAAPQTRDKVTIAVLDYDKNETPEAEVRSFPTIRLFPAGVKSSPLTYEGARTHDGMVAFIAEYGSYRALM